MIADERLNLCDREFLIYYYVKSPVRYACSRFFHLFGSGSIIPTHSTIHVDVLDRPLGGVCFPKAKVLVQGPVWTLLSKGEYLFLRVTSPFEGAAGMEAILAPQRNRIKVFMDTPWLGQKIFTSSWDLLLQLSFRASLDPSREQFVRGIGLLVSKVGLLVNAAPQSETEKLIKVLVGNFPTIGTNRLLLRCEDSGLHLYSTPWTRKPCTNRYANTLLKRGVLINPAGRESTLELTREELLANFAPAKADSSFHSRRSDSPGPLEELPAVALAVSSPENLLGELERLAAT